LAAESEQLVSLLAGGLNDKTIASELGISTRTLDRRILTLMRSLGARTRFQAGWVAARRDLRCLGHTDV
jgi:DNA-binding NarL/FixJ family response regulator